MTTKPDLSGYPGQLSVGGGESIDFMISSVCSEVEVKLVRLLHGDENPAGPGLVEEEVETGLAASVPAGPQQARDGSCVFGPVDPAPPGPLFLSLSAWPTLESDAPQTLFAHGRDGDGWKLQLLSGRLVLVAEAGGERSVLEGPPLALRHWAEIGTLVSPQEGRIALRVAASRGAGNEAAFEQELAFAGGAFAGGAPLVLAASAAGDPGSPRFGEFFNGKLAGPLLIAPPAGASVASLPTWRSGDPPPAGTVFAWDLALEPGSDRAVDVGPHGHHGRLVNAPTRLMTGPGWDASVADPRLAPDQWSAIHFHEDDLADAGWTPTVSLAIEEDLPSGVYALRVRDGEDEDHVPFVVRPRLGRARAKVALLLPTLTYLAYANERLMASGLAAEIVSDGDGGLTPEPADVLLGAHPEWGLSIYDRHSDGSGCCYSSRLRPIPNMRPGYRFWSTGGPERFPADLYIVHFLNQLGIDFDVFTDEDLHRDGQARLDEYRVVLTGSHPEYCTLAMLDAIEGYLGDGGRLMYLGGNGFYWITSLDSSADPYLVEVRRGYTGTRAWTSAPGEGFHSTTGELGGLWRLRGRDPNTLVGVAFSAQADSYDPAAGYARLPDSREPAASFIFEGVGEDEVIGEFGLINDGAAGYEIDRTDPLLGAPADLLHLATSQGRHGPSYLQTVEDIELTSLDVTGPTCDDVRADMVLVPGPKGGAVFAVGSCNWAASLSHDGYENNVARITANTLNGFLADGAAWE